MPIHAVWQTECVAPEGASLLPSVATATFRRMHTVQVTAIIEREGDGYVALCPELDVASQGATVDEARNNLREALELFLEAADPSEVTRRLHDEVFVTRFEVAVG